MSKLRLPLRYSINIKIAIYVPIRQATKIEKIENECIFGGGSQD